MNARSLCLYSLLLNAALGTALLVAVHHSRSKAPVAIAHAVAVSANSPSPRHSTLAASAAGSRAWTDALRQSGVPVGVLARVARDVFDDQWQKRQGEAQAAYMRGDADADSLAVLSLEHDQDQEQAMRVALGDADFRKWDKDNVLGGLNLQGIALTDVQTDALYDLEKKHRQELNDILAGKLKHEIDLATADQQQADVQAEYDQQLKSILGEQNFNAMRGMASDTAGDLKRDLGDTPLPASVDFESMLEIQNQWLQQRTEMTGKIQEAQDQISNYQQALKRLDESRDQEMERVLGSSTFDALQRGEDPHYQQMKRYEKNWGIDDATVDYLYRTIQYYQKAAANYEDQAQALEGQGQSVDWDAINQDLQRFARQTETAVRGQIGDDIFNKIQGNQVFPFAPTR